MPQSRHGESPALDRLQLCRDLEEFSPHIGWCEWSGEGCFCLRVESTSHWFGGETKLIARLDRWCAERGVAAVCAIADTLAASWAVAVHGGDESPRPFVSRIVPVGRAIEAMKPLPIEAVRLSRTTLKRLHELGIDVCGPLFHLPRAALAERFEPELLQRIDQACGDINELYKAYRSEPTIAAERTWEAGLRSTEPVQRMWQQILPKLLSAAADTGQGVVRLGAELVGESRGTCRLVVGLMRPLLDPRHLLDLLALRLEAVRIREPIVGTRLAVLETAPLNWQQRVLFTELAPPTESPQWTSLIERLAGRLGGDAVVRIRPRDDHQPERAWRAVPWIASRGSALPRRRANDKPPPNLERPTRLLPQPRSIRVLALAPQGHPQQFHDHGAEARVVRSWGPERIETGWWRGPSLRRDYFRVETEAGAQVWLYRDLRSRRWFLHGWFD